MTIEYSHDPSSVLDSAENRRAPAHSVHELRALGCPGDLVAAEHRSRVIDLARYARDIQARTGRIPAGMNGPGSPSTLLASEQRKYDAKAREIRELQACLTPVRHGC